MPNGCNVLALFIEWASGAFLTESRLLRMSSMGMRLTSLIEWRAWFKCSDTGVVGLSCWWLSIEVGVPRSVHCVDTWSLRCIEGGYYGSARDNLTDYETPKYIRSNSEPKASRFYLLPMIHKQGNTGRPIISSNGHPTERISEFVDYHFKALVQILPSFIKDTTHFLLYLLKLEPLPENALLVTLDVSSLYTSIHHNEGIDACRYFRNTRQDKSLPAENICDLNRMILTMNNFSFNNEHYFHFMGKFEKQAIDSSLLKPFI